MENVVLVIHLVLALCLIGIVLLQRSEGGGLGMGGGGGVMSARGAATALGKATWILAIGFIATSMALTVIAAQKSAGSSVVDRSLPTTTQAPATDTGGTTGTTPSPADLLPPAPANSDSPLVPPAPAPAQDSGSTQPTTTAPDTTTTAPATTSTDTTAPAPATAPATDTNTTAPSAPAAN
ncbi:MAG: preprotein translocase subunit SecG [Limimaricola sp.]|uniref:preprotein translocase subunit SecG n=1 Tax=Limimaricola sp. TaxID=2211665 RepID=UPI001DAEEAA4|nr:preprotein translocase subunit SecG [Limimaricola sp.]MBI1416539.1 preprotein translocase subunit SecG [Limimaricola sp.]